MSLKKPDIPCKSCPLYGNGLGFVPASGKATSGCLVILEAAGKDEAAEGVPTVGKVGHQLWQQLKRVDIERDQFMIHNVLSCQPGPQN